MKKIVLFASIIAFCAGLLAAQAGPACCPASKKAAAKATEAEAGCTVKCLKGIEMTDEQKAEVAKLTAACKEEGCSVTSAKKMKEGLKKILDEDQMAALKKSCAAAKGCDLDKSDIKI